MKLVRRQIVKEDQQKFKAYLALCKFYMLE